MMTCGLLIGIVGWICFYLERKNFKDLMSRMQKVMSDSFAMEVKLVQQERLVGQYQIALNDNQKKMEVMSAQLESFVHGDQQTS